jgi:hypothetical protein
LFKDLCGIHSSGSVQDLHLIPFSMPCSIETGITKTMRKSNKNYQYAICFVKKMLFAVSI